MWSRWFFTNIHANVKDTTNDDLSTYPHSGHATVERTATLSNSDRIVWMSSQSNLLTIRFSTYMSLTFHLPLWPFSRVRLPMEGRRRSNIRKQVQKQITMRAWTQFEHLLLDGRWGWYISNCFIRNVNDRVTCLFCSLMRHIPKRSSDLWPPVPLSVDTHPPGCMLMCIWTYLFVLWSLSCHGWYQHFWRRSWMHGSLDLRSIWRCDLSQFG